MIHLPYFRFTASEWLNGDISLESDALKGFFSDVLAYYWANDCELSYKKLQKKYKSKQKKIVLLIDLNIIKLKNGFICIDFLDEQWGELYEFRLKKQKSGAKGGNKKSSNAKAELEAQLELNSSYKEKEKEKEKENIKENKKEKKHSFPNSPFYEKNLWCENLKEWPIEKALEYWEKADNYSGAKGAKYTNWIKAVKMWESKEKGKSGGNLSFVEKQDLEHQKIFESIQLRKKAREEARAKEGIFYISEEKDGQFLE